MPYCFKLYPSMFIDCSVDILLTMLLKIEYCNNSAVELIQRLFKEMFGIQTLEIVVVGDCKFVHLKGTFLIVISE